MKTPLVITLMLWAALTVTAQQNTTFNTWDTDEDGLIEREEFTAQFIEHYFSDWNPDEERGVIEENFFRQAYAGLDSDDDRMLSDQEWMVGYNYFYDDYIMHKEIGYLDVNDDGKVSYDEYYDALYSTSFFTDVDLDKDNYLSEYELANYVFENWDMDDNGTISRGEFNNFDWYYLDV